MIKLKQKWRHLKGYGLHDARLSKTGQSAMRSIKFPIYFDDIKIRNLVADAIESDKFSLYGHPSNFLGKDSISCLLDLWIEALRIGGVFAPTSGRLGEHLSVLARQDSSFKLDFLTIPSVLRESLEESNTIKLLATTGFRSTSTENSRLRTFLSAFKEDVRSNEEVVNRCNVISRDIITKNSVEQREMIRAFFSLHLKIPDNSTWTFCISPHLEVIESPTNQGVIEQYFNVLQSDFGLDKTRILAFIGLSENGNGLQNFFNEFLRLLTTLSVEELTDKIISFNRGWSGKRRELSSRVQSLKKITQSLPRPRLASNWSDYRSDFMGKLTSWVSNYFRQSEEIQLKLEKHKQGFAILDTQLISYNDEDKAELESIVNDLKRLNFDLLGIKMNKKALSIYSLLLGEFRSRLNRLVVQTQQEVKYGKEKSEKEDVFKAPKLLPAFWGDSQMLFWDTYTNSANTLSETNTILDNLSNKLSKCEDITGIEEYLVKKGATLLESLRRVWLRNQHNRVGSFLFSIITKFAAEGDIRDDRSAFYVSAFSRRKKKRIVVNLTRDDFTDLLQSVDKFLLQDPKTVPLNELQGYFDIKKIFFAYLIARKKIEDMELSQFIFRFNLTARDYTTFFSTVNKQQLGYFVQTCLFSVIRGSIQLISRQTFIDRSVIQTINGEQSQLQFLDPSVVTHLSSAQKKYGVWIDVQEIQNNLTTIGIKKSRNSKPFTTSDLVIRPKSTGVIGSIRTSKYQIQFLDWFISKPNKKKGLLSMGGHSLMCERTIKVHWVDDRPKFTPGAPIIYCSIPFTIVNERSEQKESTAYLGADIGEFGIGYVVVRKQGDHIVILENGFLLSDELRRVSPGVKNLKQHQATGTLRMTSTYLARLRESASRGLRNRLHSLALRNNAKIVYEREIDAFETGGNKIAKLYASLKRSDVLNPNSSDADRKERAHTWGKYAKNIAVEVPASLTSQTCSKCKRHFSEEIVEGENEIVVYDGSIVLINNKLFGIEPVVSAPSRREVEVAVKQFMRPPVTKSTAVDFIVKKQTNAREVINKLVNRGNSALYICPYIDCLHITDADIQAAFNIALKGIIKDTCAKSDKEWHKTWSDKRKEMMYDPINV